MPPTLRLEPVQEVSQANQSPRSHGVIRMGEPILLHLWILVTNSLVVIRIGMQSHTGSEDSVNNKLSLTFSKQATNN